MAFFPNYLRMRYRLEMQTKMRKPFPEDQMPKCVDIVQHYCNDTIPHLFLSTSDPNSLDEIAVNASYQIATSPELRKILTWITRRTMSAIITGNWFSKDIYIRIGTSMLNKLVEEGKLSKDLNMYYHDNLVSNIAALYFEANSEDLPF